MNLYYLGRLLHLYIILVALLLLDVRVRVVVSFRLAIASGHNHQPHYDTFRCRACTVHFQTKTKQRYIESSCLSSTSSSSFKLLRLASTIASADIGESTTGTEGKRRSTSTTTTFTEECNNVATRQVTLVPISLEPIILQSSQPVLNETECYQLRQYFASMDENNDGSNHPKDTSVENKKIDSGYQVFQKVQSIIDELTMCPHHLDEPQLPRFVSYDPCQVPSSAYFYPPVVSEDGVHVDTNNGQHFRHMTVLLYLTTNNFTGATSFPLAKKLSSSIPSSSSVVASSSSSHHQEQQEQQAKARKAAKTLLDNNIHHTRLADINDELIQCGKIIEQTAEQLFQSDFYYHKQQQQQGLKQPFDFHNQEPVGIRVLPQAGYICVFMNVLNNGYADPLSFHAGEKLYDISSEDEELNNDNQKQRLSLGTKKELLTFFKEVPLSQFSNRIEFGKRVEKIRQRLLDRYF
jgi:hypothetical protein